MALEHTCPSLYIILTLIVIVKVSGEAFFLDRYHRDQYLYNKEQKTFEVTQELEAEEILIKYGFMKCRSRRKRDLSTFHPRNKFHNRISNELFNSDCDQGTVRKAILEYQREFNLPETGVLSQVEFDHMSKKRCGNVDVGDELVENRRIEDHKQRGKRSINGNKFKFANSLRNNVDRIDLDNERDMALSRKWHKTYYSPLQNSKMAKLLLPVGHLSQLSLAEQRRRKMLIKQQEYLNNIIDVSSLKEHGVRWPIRNPRSAVFNAKTSPSVMFKNGLVKWRLLDIGYSIKIGLEQQRTALHLAFKLWSEIIPIYFVEDTTSNIEDIDIEIAFGKKEHADCLHDFDGNGGEIAHSWHGGNMHFDDDERYHTFEPRSNSKTYGDLYLKTVAVHEIGHVLGLTHNKNSQSIMYPLYHNIAGFELNDIDRAAISKIYGPCKGKFNLVMDWVYFIPNRTFATYFFRNRHYWLYENKWKRTRYGDPLIVESEWKGIPSNPDAFVFIWFIKSAYSHVVIPYFFKDEYVYLYDHVGDQVTPGWPRLISEVFKGKNDSEGVPDNIDTVMYDYRDRNVYFFKDDWVYVFDPKIEGNDSFCCLRIVKLSDEFPTAPNHKPLPPQLDAAYFSFKARTQYFFKGNEVWQNVAFHMKQRRNRNLIHYLGEWSNYWHYICDSVIV